MDKEQIDAAKSLAGTIMKRIGSAHMMGHVPATQQYAANWYEVELLCRNALHQSQELERLREFIKELLNECENHTGESHGYYGCSCTGDSYEMNQVLKKYSELVEGKDGQV